MTDEKKLKCWKKHLIGSQSLHRVDLTYILR